MKVLKSNVAFIVIIITILSVGGLFIWANTPAWNDTGRVITKGTSYDGSVHYWMIVQTIAHGMIRTDEIVDPELHPICESCLVQINNTLGVTAYTHLRTPYYDWSLIT